MAAVARAQLARFAAPKSPDRYGWADRHASGECAVGLVNSPADNSCGSQRPRTQIERLGVAVDISEVTPFVTVMFEMGLTINRVGNPQCERHAAEQSVDAPGRSRVTVNRLVLKRPVPRQQQATQRRCEPQWQTVEK